MHRWARRRNSRSYPCGRTPPRRDARERGWAHAARRPRTTNRQRGCGGGIMGIHLPVGLVGHACPCEGRTPCRGTAPGPHADGPRAKARAPRLVRIRSAPCSQRDRARTPTRQAPRRGARLFEPRATARSDATCDLYPYEPRFDRSGTRARAMEARAPSMPIPCPTDTNSVPLAQRAGRITGRPTSTSRDCRRGSGSSSARARR